MRKISFLFVFLVIFLHSEAVFSQNNDFASTKVGPGNGTLVIVGGGRIVPRIYEAFACHAGGFDAPIVVIPTATAPEQIDTARLAQRWRNAGFSNFLILHTTNPFEADQDSFALRIRQARGIWFEGGRQWRLVDAYYETKTFEACHDLLNRGGVIGGSSAGATIQGSFLVRGDMEGNTIMISTNEKHRTGFGFMNNTAIDQHIDTRNRWTDLQEVIREYPELLGIGISESTAIIVQKDQFRVIGEGKVAITVLENSNQFNPPLLLESGEWYDLVLRRKLNQNQ